MGAIPASALTLRASYTGTIIDGYDLTGIFGSSDADLTGLSYTTTYDFEAHVAGHQLVNAVHDLEFGGDYDGTQGPVLRSTLTVKGVTVTLLPQWYSEASVNSFGYVYHTAENNSDDGVIVRDTWFENRGFSPVGAIDVASPVSTLLLNSPLDEGHFQFTDFDRSVDDFTTRFTYGIFSKTGSYSVAVIPEPSSWALLVLGFGGLGTVLRRRRVPAALTA